MVTPLGGDSSLGRLSVFDLLIQQKVILHYHVVVVTWIIF